MDARLFSSSLRARATEDADADYRIFVDRLKNSPQMQKIANSPEAMAALMEIAKILQGAGEHGCCYLNHSPSADEKTFRH